MTPAHITLHAALCASLAAAAALCLHHGRRGRGKPGHGPTGRHTDRTRRGVCQQHPLASQNPTKQEEMTMTETRTLPHDDYITAICEALDQNGPQVKDGRTDDCETRGTYCYLNAVIDLDMLTVGLQDEWPNGLLLIWEWHTGIEADQGEPGKGPVWQFAEMNDDGSNEYPTDLPVLGYADPAAVADAVQKVIGRQIQAGTPQGYGQWRGWTGGIIGGAWDRHAELDAACEAWAATETA